ncbi:MAG: manganese efflux pump MntP [Desulfitobacteriaceae bacterium]
MKLFWIIIVSIALGTDAFSLALAIGLTGVSKRLIFRLSFLVAIFHIIMPLAGLVAGQTLGIFLGRLAKGIGALVLIWLGVKMLLNIYRPVIKRFAFSQARTEIFQSQKLPSGVSLQGFGIYALVASVSLDALSVGFSLGTVESQIGMTVLIMGVIAGFMTGSGLILGRIFGTWLGDKAEVLGGLALILIGVHLLF